jgi:uncharacterized protein YqcC (DUF446 family)
MERKTREGLLEMASSRIDAIETEMRRIGAWQERRPDDAAFGSGAAFLMDAMDFPTWLTFVFVPRVRDIVAG